MCRLVPDPHLGCRRLGFWVPREGSGAFPRVREPREAGCLMKRQSLHRGPWAALEKPHRAPPGVSLFLPRCGWSRAWQALSRGPGSPDYLMEFLIVHLCPVQLRSVRSMPARPRFSTSRQRPVPLFMMAPFWEDARVRGGETDRQTDRQGDRETAMEKQRQGQRKMDDGERQREGQRDREVERQK